MIKISNLTKEYNGVKALDNISLEVQQGEILGFLGPNGAGKTTTMKIITGFIAPTSGKVLIDNNNVQEDSLAIRRKIGYLPENNPLYDDMRVHEYLEFIAGMRELRDNNKIEQIINTCGLSSVINKSIEELSKGFRQRVGLAAAMLGDPEILILDEPTSGLDPNQIVEIRKLIKKIGEKKTVILSTHILSEVQATCDRVVIINNGKIAASGTIEEIAKQAQGKEEIYLQIKGPAKIFRELAKIKKIIKIEEQDNYLKLQIEKGADVRENIFDCVVANKGKILEMRKISVSLEDVFRELTTD
jgi:ABC-2 type transport system ATP-binding protein